MTATYTKVSMLLETASEAVERARLRHRQGSISSHRLLRTLSADDLAIFVEQGRWLSADPGDILAEQGRPVEAITFVTEGNAREEVVSSGNNAYRAVVGFVGPGEDIGLLSLVDRAPHCSSVIAMRRLQAVEVPIDVVQRTLEAHPEWNKVIAETAVSRLRANTLWLQALV